MHVHDASSPGSLSSPPHSPDQGTPNSTPRLLATGHHVALEESTPTPTGTSPAPRRLTASGQPRKKPGPKPRVKDPNLHEPEKKTRKPRKQPEPKDPKDPKDPNAAPVPRKRRAKASLENAAVQDKAETLVQQSLPPPPTLVEPVSTPQPLAVTPSSASSRPPTSAEPSFHNNPNLSHIAVAPSTPRPSSSGQRYDPIRGGIFESKPQPAVTVPPPVSPPLNRASASPSITSLIDPPSASNSFYSPPANLNQQPSVTSAPLSPASFSAPSGPTGPSETPSHPPNEQPQSQSQQPAPSLPPSASAPPQPQAQPPQTVSTAPSDTAPMDVDSDANMQTFVPMAKTTSSHAATPLQPNAPTPPLKPSRQKDAPPPLPAGSGLLSGTPFGPIASANAASDGQGTNIWLTFELTGRDNVTINFAQEVEKKYGFAALHPRIAARRERQRQITAASAALERAAGGTSNDDMSVDLSENESNVEMGGMDDDTSAVENGGKKKRKRKQEAYDKEDDFIDDTELAWEQQALMAKDGFFVYSGPLVTEDKPAVERADGTVRRGRGRGRGGTVRGDTVGRGRGRAGGGPGSRGGSTVRKPRVTKADRAMMEQEKQAREGLAATIATKQPAPGQAVSPTSAA